MHPSCMIRFLRYVQKGTRGDIHGAESELSNFVIEDVSLKARLRQDKNIGQLINQLFYETCVAS